jgi:hypothetical protein
MSQEGRILQPTGEQRVDEKLPEHVPILRGLLNRTQPAYRIRVAWNTNSESYQIFRNKMCDAPDMDAHTPYSLLRENITVRVHPIMLRGSLIEAMHEHQFNVVVFCDSAALDRAAKYQLWQQAQIRFIAFGFEPSPTARNDLGTKTITIIPTDATTAEICAAIAREPPELPATESAETKAQTPGDEPADREAGKQAQCAVM